MKTTSLLAALAVLAFAAPALADEPVSAGGGVIDATTTSKTNHQATTPFPNSGTHELGMPQRYSVQCLDTNGVGVDVYVATVNTSTGVVTSTNSRLVRNGGIYDIDIRADRLWIAIKTLSGTANCVVAPVVR